MYKCTKSDCTGTGQDKLYWYKVLCRGGQHIWQSNQIKNGCAQRECMIGASSGCT